MLSARKKFVVLAMCAFSATVQPQPRENLPSTIINGIGNVASSATNFLSGVVQRQKELLHRMTDTATDYIVSAVEKPRNLLINATRATTGYIGSAASKGLEFKLRRFLEKFRTRMPYGIPELGIPPLEPFTLQELNLETSNPEIGNVSLLIKDLVVHRLSTFSIDRAKLSLIGPTITVNLSIPNIYATGYYNISGVLGDMFVIHGAGPFELSIYDFQLYVNTVLGFSRGMHMRSLDLDFTLSSIALNLENFMGGEKIGHIMNQVFQELMPDVLKIIKPEILPGIKEYVAMRANATISHLTMRDLLSILLGESEIRDFTHMLIP